MDSAQNKYESLKPFPNLYKADGQKLGIGKESAEMIRDVAAEVLNDVSYYNNYFTNVHRPESIKLVYSNLRTFLRDLDNHSKDWSYTTDNIKTRDCEILEKILSELYKFSGMSKTCFQENRVPNEM